MGSIGPGIADGENSIKLIQEHRVSWYWMSSNMNFTMVFYYFMFIDNQHVQTTIPMSYGKSLANKLFVDTSDHGCECLVSHVHTHTLMLHTISRLISSSRVSVPIHNNQSGRQKAASLFPGGHADRYSLNSSITSRAVIPIQTTRRLFRSYSVALANSR